LIHLRFEGREAARAEERLKKLKTETISRSGRRRSQACCLDRRNHPEPWTQKIKGGCPRIRSSWQPFSHHPGL